MNNADKLTTPKIVLYEAEIEFKVKNKEVKFTIVHNIPNDINIAFETWVYRSQNYTAECFCEYLLNKDFNNVAMLKSDYENLNKQLETK